MGARFEEVSIMMHVSWIVLFCFLAPEFVKRLPAEETVEEGTTVSFACKIVGFPKPTVTWYKDDDVIGEGCRAITDSDENGIHSISLKDVSKCDSGVYKCKASNLEGSSANNLYVSVKGIIVVYSS